MVIGIFAQFCCTWAGRSDQVSVSSFVGMRVHVLSNAQSCRKAEIISKSKSCHAKTNSDSQVDFLPSVV